jgi:hypothetical protein
MTRARRDIERKKSNLRKQKRLRRSKVGTPARSTKKQAPKSDPSGSSTTAVTPQAAASQQAPIKDEPEVKEGQTGKTGKDPVADTLNTLESPAHAGAIQRFQRMSRAVQQRWERLRNNRELVWETYRLRFKLEPFVQNNLDQLKQVFTPTFFVSPQNLQTVRRRIGKIDNKELKALLERYAKYVLRYGVVFTLQQSEPHFRTQWTGYGLNKFHVAIRNGEVEPIGGPPAWIEAPPLPRPLPSDDFDFAVQTPMSDDLETDALVVPTGLQSLVEEGKAKYVLIKDEDQSSLLRQITDFAYSPDQITVIDYASDLQQMRFLLVGENVPLHEIWPKLREGVASYQRTYAKHDQRGRRTDIRKLKTYLAEIVRSENSMQDKAAKLVKDKNSPDYSKRLRSMQSHLSQLKKKLEE